MDEFSPFRWYNLKVDSSPRILSSGSVSLSVNAIAQTAVAPTSLPSPRVAQLEEAIGKTRSMPHVKSCLLLCVSYVMCLIFCLKLIFWARGRLVVNGALDFERLEDMQRGDVMHGVSLEDEPFNRLCCRARQLFALGFAMRIFSQQNVDFLTID